MKRKTSRRPLKRKTRRNRRMKGGDLAELQAIIDAVPLRPNLLVNDKSKFVVITYWWGRGNTNANLQKPCPEDVMSDVKEILEEELREEDESYDALFRKFDYLIKQGKAPKKRTPAEEAEWSIVSKERNRRIQEYFKPDEMKLRMKDMAAQLFDKLRKSPPGVREPKTYDKMIEMWESTCREMKCNYLTAEYTRFDVPKSYQLAINVKPLFIKKALSVCAGKGVLYIDGDMFIRKYPELFDMPNIDFAARSWNFDPRSSRKYKTDICFDPYIFETSGGTMYFANTPQSLKLLDEWARVSSLPVNGGKADDRILSQIYTVDKFAPRTNTLHLPIEYLWLTDNYVEFDYGKGDAKVADIADCIIEHPYCLTGEERASEMSGSINDREPPGYNEKISDIVECNTRGGTFYEYIFFLHNEELVKSYAPYLKYMKNAVNPNSGEKLFEVVDFADKYGRYSQTAFKNFLNSPVASGSGTGVVRLPILPPIADILKGLRNGRDVMIGSHPIPQPDVEFSARNIGTERDPYLANIKIDHSSSMYISAKNPIVIDLLAMCKTLEDINIHLKESFLFLSRIRWLLTSAQQQAESIPGAKKKGMVSMEML